MSIRDIPLAEPDAKGARTVRDIPQAVPGTEGALPPVYLASSELLGLKVIRPLPAAGAEADLYVVEGPEGERVLRLERAGGGMSAEVAARLDEVADDLGEGVVRTFARGTDVETGRRYEIQEYLPLGDLAGFMARGPLGERDVLALADSLSRTLDLLHSHGIVHRDVKPANILLRSLDPVVPALCDFGISSSLPGGVSLKLTRAAFTALYTAPEAFADLAGPPGDFWSLGAVLLEAATGSHPLAGLPFPMIMRELLTRGIAVPAGLPPPVAKLLRGLLARDDTVRWRRGQVADSLAGRDSVSPESPAVSPVTTAVSSESPAVSPVTTAVSSESPAVSPVTSAVSSESPAVSPVTSAGPPVSAGTEADLPDRAASPAAAPGPNLDGGGTYAQLPAPYRVLGEEFSGPEALAARFNRDGPGWDAGTRALQSGEAERWLRNSGRGADADRIAGQGSGAGETLHERLFAFVTAFDPEGPPAFRGVTLTTANVGTLLKDRETLSGDALAALDALTGGTLRRFPEIARAGGRPLDRAVELLLARSGDLDAATMAGALAAYQAPRDFLWGYSGPPGDPKALEFALKAGCPLLTRSWLDRATPPGEAFPLELLAGPLNSPETYKEGVRLALRWAAEAESRADEDWRANAERIAGDRRIPDARRAFRETARRFIERRGRYREGEGRRFPVYLLLEDTASVGNHPEYMFFSLAETIVSLLLENPRTSGAWPFFSVFTTSHPGGRALELRGLAPELAPDFTRDAVRCSTDVLSRHRARAAGAVEAEVRPPDRARRVPAGPADRAAKPFLRKGGTLFWGNLRDLLFWRRGGGRRSGKRGHGPPEDFRPLAFIVESGRWRPWSASDANGDRDRFIGAPWGAVGAYISGGLSLEMERLVGRGNVAYGQGDIEGVVRRLIRRSF
jgi:serine/threonine protein kinase